MGTVLLIVGIIAVAAFLFEGVLLLLERRF